jgi:hypothetical protein
MSNWLFTKLSYDRKTCFVDLKKASDSIWHEGLLYKWMERCVGGKTYNIIKSMYKKQQVCS